MTKVGIVVPVLNYFEGLADLVLSIKTKHDYRVYVQPQWWKPVPLAAAWNRGALQAFDDGCDYAIVCNDDILFAPECIDNMVFEYERLRKENVIMVTPNNIWGEMNGDKYAILDYKLPEGRQESFADHPNFSCFLIAPEYFAMVGLFDENFDPAWWEDNDSHYRAALVGLREVCTTFAPIVHLGSVTTSKMENPSSRKSEAYYRKKWGSTKRDLNELFKTPYNDPQLSPREWRKEPAE